MGHELESLMYSKVKGHNRSEFIVRSIWFDSSDVAFGSLLSWASRGPILDEGKAWAEARAVIASKRPVHPGK